MEDFSLLGGTREEQCSSQPDCDTVKESKTDGERFQVGSNNTQGLKGPEISNVCSVSETLHFSVEPSIWQDGTFKTF